MINELPVEACAPSDEIVRGIRKKDPKYINLKADIERNGVELPLLVTNAGTDEDPDYRIIDGLQRWSCAVAAGRETVPVRVVDHNEEDTLVRQMRLNLHRVEMRPIEYTQGLLRIVAADPEKSLKELADEMGKSEGWLRDRLSLVKLPEDIQNRVTEGEIPLSNAYALAKLPDEEEMNEWADRAAGMAPADFLPQCAGRVKELRKLKRGQPKPEPTPQPSLRKRGEMLDAYRELGDRPEKKGYDQGWYDAIAWAVRMDDASRDAFFAGLEEKAAKKAEKAEKAKAKANKGPSIAELLGTKAPSVD